MFRRGCVLNVTVRQCDAIDNERCQQREREERGRGIGEVKVKKKQTITRTNRAHSHRVRSETVRGQWPYKCRRKAAGEARRMQSQLLKLYCSIHINTVYIVLKGSLIWRRKCPAAPAIPSHTTAPTLRCCGVVASDDPLASAGELR